jgi:hypothetical protein
MNNRRDEVLTYGTVVVQNDETFVRLDGAETLTPVSKAMDAVDGDRVMVSLRNHTAVIVGNISSPASARTASSYMKLTEDGLAVGELDEDGEPVGAHSLIGSGMYRIVDENGNTVALFSDGQILLLGDVGTAKGSIRVVDDVLLLNGKDAVGTRTVHVDEDDDRHISEVVCKWDDTTENIVTALRAYIEGSILGEIIVRPNRIDLRTSAPGEVYVNGIQILTTDNLMISGIVKLTGTIAGSSYRKFSYVVDTIPSGYRLVGLVEITTNHSRICHMTEFFTNPSTNQIGATFCNESANNLTLEIRMEWFALYSNTNEYVSDVDINLPNATT